MSTIVIVKKAILDMKDRTGSSLVAINKWIESNEKVSRRNEAVGPIPLSLVHFTFSVDKTELQKPHTFCASLRNGEVDFF